MVSDTPRRTLLTHYEMSKFIILLIVEINVIVDYNN